MLKTFYNRLSSLTFGLWLMAGIIMLLGIGSFVNTGQAGEAINHLPLVVWLRTFPFPITWWLWVTILLLALLAVNTVLCTIDSLRTRWGKTSLHFLLAPHLMHAGFLLIVLAHLASAVGGFSQQAPVPEGGGIGFPDGTRLQVARVDATMGPMGFPLDFRGEIRHQKADGMTVTVISPNNPYFYRGFGVYLKDVIVAEQRGALLEIHREPGAGLALAGAIFFLAGNLVVVARRRG
jgi:hypothetical protein